MCSKYDKIRIAVIGVGNCTSSLIQEIRYYRDKNPDDAFQRPEAPFVLIDAPRRYFFAIAI